VTLCAWTATIHAQSLASSLPYTSPQLPSQLLCWIFRAPHHARPRAACQRHHADDARHHAGLSMLSMLCTTPPLPAHRLQTASRKWRPPPRWLI